MKNVVFMFTQVFFCLLYSSQAGAIGYDGQWTGTTNQGYDVKLSVTGTIISSFSIKFSMSGYYCSSTSTNTYYYNQFSGDKFSINESVYNSDTYKYDDLKFTGEFTGDTVTGTWYAENSSCGVISSGTWSGSNILTTNATTSTSSTLTTTTTVLVTTTATTATSAITSTTTTIPDTTAIQLFVGWNLVGLKGGEAVQAESLVAGHKNEISSVWKWVNSNSGEGTSSAGTWSVYLPNAPDGGMSYAEDKGFSLLSTIHFGEGFWVNSTDPVTLP